MIPLHHPSSPPGRSRCLLLGAVVLLAAASCATRGPSLGTPAPEPGIRYLATVVDTPPRALPGAGTSSGSYLPGGEYPVSARVRRTVRNVARDHGLRRVDGWPIRPLGVYCAVLEDPGGRPPSDVLDLLREDPRVESVQLLQRFEVLGTRPPGDPYAEMQAGLGSMRIWEIHEWADGSGTSVAVVDTGVDAEHPDLADRLHLVRDFVDDRPDVPGEVHGTAIAGIIVSAPRNGIGTVGVAPGARLLALRACWEEDASGVCDSFSLAKALAFVVESGPDVVNLSLTGPRDPLLERLVRRALESGIAIVTAVPDRPGEGLFPSGVPGVVPTRADGPGGDVAPGEPTALVAPGTDVLAAHPGGAFDFVSGSSFAAAHVSGVLALLRQLAPEAPFALLVATLRATASGSGVLDACAALERLERIARCSQPSE